jgi:Tfp pilus assembly protein PilF
VPALLNLGYVAKVAGQLDRAEAVYRRAVEVDALRARLREHGAYLPSAG